MGTTRRIGRRILGRVPMAALMSLLGTAAALAGSGPGPWPK